MNPRSHAPRGNAVLDALRPLDGQSVGPGSTTRSVGENIPTQSVGTRRQCLWCLQVITNSTVSPLNRSLRSPCAVNRIEQRILQSRWLQRPDLVAARTLGIVHHLCHDAAVQLFGAGRADSEADRTDLGAAADGGLVRDVQGNVLLFVPWGFLLAMAMARRGAGFIVVVAVAMCTGAFLSGSVEVTQLFAPSRTTSFIDLVTNSFGATVGALIGWPWVRLVWPVLSIRFRQWITRGRWGPAPW